MAKATENTSALDDLSSGLSALDYCQAVQTRAANAGFVWRTSDDLFRKLAEEIDELKIEVAHEATNHARLQDELGDVLLVATSLCGHFNLGAEETLRAAANKFARRFKAMEALAATDGNEFAALDDTAKFKLWQRVKAQELN